MAAENTTSSITDTTIICSFCGVPVNDESPVCYLCREYKGLMTASEAIRAGYVTADDIF